MSLISDRDIFMKFFIQRLIIFIDSIKARTSIASIETNHLAIFFALKEVI